MGNKKWVCTKCSQDFTRKYSADRHIRILHSGLAKRVRLLDYIVGRRNGEYIPSDPSFYRSGKRQQEKLRAHRNAFYTHDRSPLGYDLQEMSKPPTNLAVEEQNSRANNYHLSPSYNSPPAEPELGLPTEGDNTNHYKRSGSFTGSERPSSKFEEIKELLRPHFSPENLEQILTMLSITLLNKGGDDSFLDDYLKKTRNNVNTMEATDYLFSLQNKRGKISKPRVHG